MADTFGLSGNRGPQLGKHAPLDLHDFFLRVQHLDFIFLQFRRGEAFCIDQRLLPLVIRGCMVQVGLADLDVITENRIKFDFERMDAGALPLTFLNLRDVLFAVAAQVAQIIKFSVNTFLNNAAVRQGKRRLRDNRLFNAAAQVGQFIQQHMQFLPARRLQSRQSILDQRCAIQRRAQGQHIPGIGCFQRDPAEKSFNVLHAFDRAPQLFPRDKFLDAYRHRVQALVDFCDVNGRAQQP